MIDRLKGITYGVGIYSYSPARGYIAQTSHYFLALSNPIAFAAPSGRLTELRAMHNVKDARKRVSPGYRAYDPQFQAGGQRFRNLQIPDMPIRFGPDFDSRPRHNPPSATIITPHPNEPPIVEDRSPCPLCR
jgi:hypothetical protein